MNKEGVVIAFDFGLKRIGCAVGQKLTGTASPIGTIKNNKKDNNLPKFILIQGGDYVLVLQTEIIKLWIFG